MAASIWHITHLELTIRIFMALVLGGSLDWSASGVTMLLDCGRISWSVLDLRPLCCYRFMASPSSLLKRTSGQTQLVWLRKSSAG